MPVQLPLPGIEDALIPARKPRARPAVRRPRPPFNLFFALSPAPDDALALAALGLRLAQAHGLPCQPLAAERLHVSLHNLGGYAGLPQDLVHRASQVADAMALPAFDVVFDQAMVFRSAGAPYVLCGGQGLDALRRFRLALGMALADADLPVQRSFTPHMTLAYRGRLGLVHAIDVVRWPAHELVLINSHQGHTVHEVLGRWPLPGA